MPVVSQEDAFCPEHQAAHAALVTKIELCGLWLSLVEHGVAVIVGRRELEGTKGWGLQKSPLLVVALAVADERIDHEHVPEATNDLVVVPNQCATQIGRASCRERV